jgi:hypothetical protein
MRGEGGGGRRRRSRRRRRRRRKRRTFNVGPVFEEEEEQEEKEETLQNWSSACSKSPPCLGAKGLLLGRVLDHAHGVEEAAAGVAHVLAGAHQLLVQRVGVHGAGVLHVLQVGPGRICMPRHRMT